MGRMADLSASVLGETPVTTYHLWEGNAWLLGLELYLTQAQEIPVVILLVCLFYVLGKKQSGHWETGRQNKEADNGIFW